MLRDAQVFSSYSVNDNAAALKFYGETLGCDMKDNGMGLELVFPSGHVVFMYEKADHQPATFTVLNFTVDDINKTIDELAAKGITMERYDSLPSEQDERGVLRGKSADMGPDIAWFKDPAGNILSVLEN